MLTLDYVIKVNKLNNQYSTQGTSIPEIPKSVSGRKPKFRLEHQLDSKNGDVRLVQVVNSN